MTRYLEGGWYSRKTRTRLRDEVIDGAMDVAGMLLRADVPPQRLLRIALKVRSSVVIADPLMRGHARFGPADRDRIAQRIAPYADEFPELQAFLTDCLDHVGGTGDMTALYLHLVHIARMMQLLTHALSGPVSSALLGAGVSSAAAKRSRTKSSAAKAAATKSPARRRVKSPTAKKKPASKAASPEKPKGASSRKTRGKGRAAGKKSSQKK